MDRRLADAGKDGIPEAVLDATFDLTTAVMAGIYIILTSSLNITNGYTGLFQFGHAAFYGIGAYTAALMAKGVSPGAALVFLMTGPATNLAAVTTLWKMCFIVAFRTPFLQRFAAWAPTPLERIEYNEADGDSTRYEFRNLTINPEIEESRFRLELGADVGLGFGELGFRGHDLGQSVESCEQGPGVSLEGRRPPPGRW